MNESDYEEIRRKSEEMMEELKEEDKKACENDTLVGRYFSVPVADGKAFYQITEVKREWVKIEHYDHEMNDYLDDYFQHRCWIDRSWAEDKLEQMETLEKLFS